MTTLVPARVSDVRQTVFARWQDDARNDLVGRGQPLEVIEANRAIDGDQAIEPADL